MIIRVFQIVLLLFIIAVVNCGHYSASFYGDSFSFESLADYQSATTVSLQFQTQAPNGLILLAAGQEDYLIISLTDGRIKVQINVGNGETVIVSPEGNTYNDLLWHRVKFVRSGSELNLQVNKHKVASATLPLSDRSNELNMNLGVFLGGYDYNVGASYLEESTPFFRGCILTAEYNLVDVLDPINDVPGQKSVHNVNAGCSGIFRARKNEPLSFKSSNAYLKFDRWTSTADGTFECSVKTTGHHGLLLFNSGWDRQEFIALEMVGGTVRASVNRGSGVIGIQSTKTVNDGLWHKIKILFSPSVLEIRIDKNKTRIFLEHLDDSSSGELNLKGSLLVGGIDVATKVDSSTIPRGIGFSSFPGCMKNIRINSVKKTVKDLLASRDVDVGCKNTEPFDTTSLGRLPGAGAGLPTFVILSHDQKNKKRPKKPSETEIFLQEIDNNVHREVCYSLHIDPVQLTEGSGVNITESNLAARWSARKGERRVANDNSAASFTFDLTSVPFHGVLSAKGRVLGVGGSITAQDVARRLVRYEHDGSDNFSDSFSFRVGTNGLDSAMQSMDLKQYRICDEQFQPVDNSTIYTLNFTLTPLDDPPTLGIPSGYTFTPLRNSKTPLPGAVLSATDPDSETQDIHYHVLGIGSGLYIERSDDVGRPVHSFSQADLNNGSMYFVHAGGADNSRLLLQVSNHPSIVSGHHSASTVLMRIASKPLEIKISRNRGITLVEGEVASITPDDISFTSNAGDSVVQVVYRITAPPIHGEIQLFQGSDSTTGLWTTTTTFTDQDLSNGRVRYLNVDAPVNGSPTVSDSFSFLLSGAGVDSKEFLFNVTIIRVEVRLLIAPTLLRGASTQLPLSTNQVAAEVSGLGHANRDEIQIFVARELKIGELRYTDTNMPIKTAGAFTMAELDQSKIELVVDTRGIEPGAEQVSDFATLYALVRGKYRSSRQNLTVTYFPDETIVKVTGGYLEIDEGSEAVITPALLQAETLLHRRFLFNLTNGPRHGALMRKGDDLNVTSFTTEDIVDGRLLYRHNGDESTSDSFAYVITPILDGELPKKVQSLRNVSVKGEFHIDVDPVNDNAPIRTVDRPFQVARYSQRLLTPSDLWYTDPDLDQDELDLRYERRGITNGDIVNATSGKPMFQFTQRDITSNLVMFKHKKKDFGRFVFWVRDGKHFSTGLFIVMASYPYIRRLNASRLLVQRGENVTVALGNLQFETNVKGLTKDIKYRVTSPPKHGRLVLLDDDVTTSDVTEFTQRDVADQRLAYLHGNSHELNDSLHYVASAGETEIRGNLSIHIYLESLQQPPSIKRNRPVVVQQGGDVTIARSHLRAVHPAVKPRDVIYTLTSPPALGRLLVERRAEDGTRGSVEVKEFSQFDINQGHLTYAQSSNTSFQHRDPIDSFTYDVSNGILSLRNVTSYVEVIPTAIPLRTSNFSVQEGMSRVLVSDLIFIGSSHFDTLDLRLVVLQQPRHGRLESSRDAGVSLERCQWRLVTAEFVYYVHDGSDTTQDSFELQLETVDGGRRSAPAMTYVDVIPVNDQVPSVVNNTGMTVWVNSITTVTSSHLGAADPDSAPADLLYEILPPQNGHLALRESPDTPVVNFTQQRINDGDLVFVHKGAFTGGFTFQVNDRLNYDTKHIYVIRARPLVLTVDPTTTAQIFPGSTLQITNTSLHAHTNDPDPLRHIYYVITRRPKFGVITRRNNATGGAAETDGFTQRDLDLGRISYEQNLNISLWNQTDVLVLTALSLPADDVKDILVPFNVTYDAYVTVGRNSSIVNNTGMQVLEGDTRNITTSLLDASNLLKKVKEPEKRKFYSLRYRLVTVPQHGALTLRGKPLAANSTFSQRALEGLLVAYIHDGSEKPKDWFEFESFLVSKHRPHHYRHPVFDVLHINVTQVNDNPPQLMTQSPSLEVVHGYSATITPSLLRSIDADNSPSHIQYAVIREPKYGRLVCGSSDVAATTFTQADIDAGKVLFVQNNNSDALHPASDEVSSDAFYFGLSDGFHRPSFYLFRIKIHPVSLNLRTTVAHLPQGRFAITLGHDVINATTNGDVGLVTYMVEDGPHAGALYLGDVEVSGFSHADLTSRKISYVMSRTDTSSDNFTLLASYNATRRNASATLNIVVKPLVKKGILKVASESSVQLTLMSLNSTKLALLTDSTPVYSITRQPEYAYFVVKPATTNSSQGHRLQRRSSPDRVTAFTHYDVTNGIVFLHVDSVNMTNVTHLNDSFTYRLSVEDGSVQPADDSFHFKITPKSTSRIVHEATSHVTNATAVNTTTTVAPAHNTTAQPDVTNTSSRDTPFVTSSPILINPESTTRGTSAVEDDDEKKVKVAGPASWVIPLIVSLCVIMLIAIALLIICIRRRRGGEKSGPSFVKGHETDATSPRGRKRHRATIDAHTHVTVTSRTDTLDSAQRCPTANVLVTPLRGIPSDETDSGSFDDGYISTSVPYEGVLANAALGGNFGPSGHRPDEGDVPGRPMLVHPFMYASDDSILSDDADENEEFLQRNFSGSVGSLPVPGSRGLSVAPPAKVSQYWV